MITLLQMIAWLVILVVVPSWAGYRVVSATIPSSDRDLTLGLGILLGGTLFAITAFLLGNLGARRELSILFALLIGAGVPGSTQGRNRSATQELGLFGSGVAGGRVPLVLRTTGLTIFGFSSSSLPTQLLGFSILMLPQTAVASGSIYRLSPRKQGLISVAILACSSIAFRVQSSWWHATSNDAPYLEFLSVSLARFGLSPTPGSVDGTVQGYHILAYLWSGSVGVFSNAPPFLVINFLLPLLMSASLVLIATSATRQLNSSPTTSVVSTAALLVLLRESSFTSADLANWAIAGYIFAYFLLPKSLWQEPCKTRIIKRELLLAMLAIVAVLGKGTVLVAIVSVAIGASASNFFSARAREIKTGLYAAPFHLVGVAPVVWLWYLPGLKARFQFSEASLVSNIAQLGISEGIFQAREILQALPTLAGTALFWILKNRTTKSTPGSNSQLATTLLCSVVLGTFISVVFSRDYFARTYQLTHALVIFYVLSTLVILGEFTKVIPPSPMLNFRRLFLWFFFTVSFVVIDLRILGGMVERLWVSSPTRWIPIAVLNLKMPVLFILAMLFADTSKVPIRRPSVLFRQVASPHSSHARLFLVALAIWTLANQIDQLQLNLSSPAKSLKSPFLASHPDNATADLGQWVRHNLPTDAILASNSFCCEGSAWVASAISQLKDFSKTYPEMKSQETAYGGANFLLPAVTQRRFVLAGPRFVLVFHRDTAQIERLLNASVGYGANMSDSFASDLRSAGAEYFIGDRFVTKLVPHGKSVQLLFSNERYWVSRLEAQ